MSLKQWWNCLSTFGPLYGYHPNAAKTSLVIHEKQEEEAKRIFDGTGISVTAEGNKHLGAALGSPLFVEDFTSHKVDEWIEEVEKLAAVAGSQPQAAYAAYIHGTKNKWNYFCRTTPNCSHLLQPLEEAIHRKLLPAISHRPPCSSTERELLSLPTKLGGIHFPNPTVTATSEFEASMEVITPLVNLIIDQNMSFENDPTLANSIISAVKKRKLRNRRWRPRESGMNWRLQVKD